MKFEWDNSFSKLTAKTVGQTATQFNVLRVLVLVDLAKRVWRCSSQVSFKLSYSTY